MKLDLRFRLCCLGGPRNSVLGILVHAKSVSPRKGLAAHVALVRPLAGVDALMAQTNVGPGKRFAAHFALVGPLTGMSALMR